MKKKFLAFALALTLIVTALAQLPAAAADTAQPAAQTQEAVSAAAAQLSVTLEVVDYDCFSKYGNVYMNMTVPDFLAAGFSYGDLVDVSFLGQTITVPFCDNTVEVDSDQTGLFGRSQDIDVMLAINYGSFAETYGIASKVTAEDGSYSWELMEGVSLPLEITVSMHEQGGYYEEYVTRSYTYTNERSDYAELTDEQFANFRNIATTGMGANVLYRSSSPINPLKGRNTYADTAIENAGVTVVLNLADDRETAEGYEGYADTYYASTDYIALSMDMDVLAESFQAALAEGLRFMAANPGVYDIHCTEGKDRTGFVCAVLECLMGASAQEVVEDYMTTYYNFFGITEDSASYDVIANGNIVKSLQESFGVDDIYQADLQACAENYLEQIGLSGEEIQQLIRNLGQEGAAG